MTLAERLAVELSAPLGDRDPKRLVPMLCGRDETGERVLAQEGWLYELKLDGVRILADKRKDRVTLGYRKTRDATSSYPEIAAALATLAEERVLLDGEIVAFDADGKPNFQLLGTRIQSQGDTARRAVTKVPVVYVVFDVLVIGDRDVTGLPLESRKAILEQVLGAATGLGGLVRIHPTFPTGTELFQLCREQQLEGVVAKRCGSTYRFDDRSSDWIKVKCELDGDFVVIGWAEGEGKRSRLGALDLGAYDGSRLLFRGNVGSGLDDDTIDMLLDRLKPLEVSRPVAEGKYSAKKSRHHVLPEIVVSVRHAGASDDGALRFPVFRGLRDDLRPEDCTLEVAKAGAAPEADGRRSRITAPSAVVLVDGTTKGALCKYYEAVAPLLLPYLRGRTCPPMRADARRTARGRQGAVKLWPLPEWTPSWVRTHAAARGKEEVRGVLVGDLDTLLFLVEAGAVSLLMTPVREAAPASADFLALGIEGERAWQLALRMREIVKATGLEAFAKIAGAGLEVLVPIGEAPAAAAHALTALFARLLAREAESMGVKVERLHAPVAPWAVSVPVTEGMTATVSLPVSWDELASLRGAATTTTTSLGAVCERLARDAAGGVIDPMRPLLGAKVDFARAVSAIERLVAAGGFEG